MRENLAWFNGPFHFGFPKSKIFVTLIPKCGSTSLLSSFVALEHDINTEPFPTVWNSSRTADRYRLEDLSQIQKFPIRLLIVRDPVERLLSFYNDKVVDNDDVLYRWLFRSKNWYQCERKSSKLCAGSGFEEFLNELCDDRSRLREDKHLRPQSKIAFEPYLYNKVIWVNQVNSLFDELGIPVMRETKNSSSQQLRKSHLSESLMKRIKAHYSEDYFFFEQIQFHQAENENRKFDFKKKSASTNKFKSVRINCSRIFSASPRAIRELLAYLVQEGVRKKPNAS